MAGINNTASFTLAGNQNPITILWDFRETWRLAYMTGIVFMAITGVGGFYGIVTATADYSITLIPMTSSPALLAAHAAGSTQLTNPVVNVSDFILSGSPMTIATNYKPTASLISTPNIIFTNRDNAFRGKITSGDDNYHITVEHERGVSGFAEGDTIPAGTTMTVAQINNYGQANSVSPSTRLFQLPPARLVATVNMTLSGLPVIDGIQTKLGDIVVLSKQTTGSQNGPWVVGATWSRPDWYASGSPIQVAPFLTVKEGNIHARQIWWCGYPSTNITTFTVDTDITGWSVYNMGRGTESGTNNGGGVRYLAAAIGFPNGSTPYLYLLSSLYIQSLAPVSDDPYYTNFPVDYIQHFPPIAGIRPLVSVSTNGGETFGAGQAVGGTSCTAQSYAIYVTGSGNPIPTVAFGLNALPIKYGSRHMPAGLFKVLPNGRLYVNVPGCPINGFYYKHARICDDIMARESAWRDSTQDNADFYGPFTSYEWSQWVSSGAAGANLGGGGRAKQPWAMYLWFQGYFTANTHNYISRDAGDTWTVDPDHTGIDEYLGAGPVTVHHRGMSFDGNRFSLDDFLETALPATGGNFSNLANSGESEVAYTIVTSPYPNNAFVSIHRGNYFELSDVRPMYLSITKDGNNLTRITFNTNNQVAAWAYNGKIVVACWGMSGIDFPDLGNGKIPYTIQIIASDNDGKWWRKTCHSSDGGQAWIKD